MLKSYLKLGGTALFVPLLVGCVNDDYDLANIDTTTRIAVNDLVIPMNMDNVTLGDIITFDENSKIQPMTIGGQECYALRETGTFNSEAIEIDRVSAPAPSLSPTEAQLDQVPIPPVVGPVDNAISYEIKNMGNDVNYNAGHIDEAIVDLDYVTTDISFKISMSATNAAGAIESSTFTDVVIQLPKGLKATQQEGSYDPASGRWTISKLVASGSSASMTIKAAGIDFKQAGAKIDDNHSFDYAGEFRIISGVVTLQPNSSSMESLPETLHFHVDYEMSDMVAKSFSGTINYKLDGLDIAPVNLSDIPDFLSGESTNIRLANPQIYLKVNNPVASYGLDCQTGITLTAIREGADDIDFSPDNGAFKIKHDAGSGPYNFVLAPSPDNLTTPDAFSNPEFVKFTSLSDIVATPEGYSVTGLPEQIGIRLVDPQIPKSHVSDFALGSKLPAVEGTYEMVAPIALEEGSVIIYTKQEDGWNDEDVDAITISNLSLTTTATNNCPVSAELYIWPIDKNGNRIPGVEIKSTTLPANSADVPLTFEMTGEIKHLDGLIYEARVNGSKNTSAMSPSQTIILKEIRTKVSGYYEKEL